MLGFSVTDLGRVRVRAAEYKALGYPAQKWFFRHGPMSGHEGMHKNVELVRTLRETVGDDYDIMLDCWQSFDPIYTIELADRNRRVPPRWLEECVMPDRIDSYRRVKDTRRYRCRAPSTNIRVGVQTLSSTPRRSTCCSPDIYWAGGLSEVMKNRRLRLVHDLMVIPHGHSTPAGLHFSLAQSPLLTPLQEYLVKWNAINQHFLAHPIVPRHGAFGLPAQPGLGMDLDPNRLRRRRNTITRVERSAGILQFYLVNLWRNNPQTKTGLTNKGAGKWRGGSGQVRWPRTSRRVLMAGAVVVALSVAIAACRSGSNAAKPSSSDRPSLPSWRPC